jgi:N-acetylglucosaminyldiphosphoundecaprenol N-acetyl-beta-D-mannosaminyltransferase
MEQENLLGVRVDAIDMQDAVTTVGRWIRDGERSYVCVRDVHGIMESRRDAALRDIHNAAGLVTPDGMPLVWFLRIKGHKHAERVYGPDLMMAVLEAADGERWRHFFYGSTERTLDQLCRRLRQLFPGICIVGTEAPPFRALTAAEREQTIQRINESRADIVWVGLGTPKQERWMAQFRPDLAAGVLIGVGAAFDFHAGTIRQAPRLLQRSGFEWLFRLAMEPRRLWRRYLRNNPTFVVAVLGQLLGLHRYPRR